MSKAKTAESDTDNPAGPTATGGDASQRAERTQPKAAPGRLRIQHLLGLEGVCKEDLERILVTAESFKEVLDRPIKKVPPLRGQTIVNLFYEPSTRTRISFELAEKRLSADVVNFSASASSVSKGESLRDTVKNILAMRTDVVVIRHPCPGAPHFLTRTTDAIILNAGDGAHEHPTQGLLDMYTLWERWRGFEGRRILIVGDILHSRVARSNIWGLLTMGAKVGICGPALWSQSTSASSGWKSSRISMKHSKTAPTRSTFCAFNANAKAQRFFLR